MAGLTHNGAKVTIPDGQLPDGYTRPTVTQFADFELKYSDISFSVAKSGVQNATAATTLSNLITALNAAIVSYLTADLHIDTLTVTAWSDCKQIRLNNLISEVFWTNGTVNYVCVVDIYVKTA